MGTTHITNMTDNANYPQATRVPTDAQVQVAHSGLAAAEADVEAANTVGPCGSAAREARWR